MALSSTLGTSYFTGSLKKKPDSRALSLGQRIGNTSSSFGFPRSAFLNLKSNNTARSMGVVNSKVVGIDLGTTNSAIAAMEGGKPTIIPNAEGQTTTPSVVAYTNNGDVLVGQIAKLQAAMNPRNTFFSAKRFIGRTISEVDENNDVKIHYCPATGKILAPEEISAQVLRKLVGDASRYLNDKVTKAVITVPAQFNDSQRTATKDAGRIAGLGVLHIINEPTAALLACLFEKKNKGTFLVFDLGGGTFDVSVLEVCYGAFNVLSTSGDAHLGGDDFDKIIVDWLASNFKRDEGIDLLNDRKAHQRLIEKAEKAKVELSSLTQTNIFLPFITTTADGPKQIETTLTRAKFEELCSDLLDRLKIPVENSLRDAKLSFEDIDEVVLVGGSTRIPAVQGLVRKMIGKDPNVTVNPDEVVALGAALQAGFLAGDVSDIWAILDKTPSGVKIDGSFGTNYFFKNTETSKLNFSITGSRTVARDDEEAEEPVIEMGELVDAILEGSTKAIRHKVEKIAQESGELMKEELLKELGEFKDSILSGSTQAVEDAIDAVKTLITKL